jgi:hypothetical protein
MQRAFCFSPKLFNSAVLMERRGSLVMLSTLKHTRELTAFATRESTHETGEWANNLDALFVVRVKLIKFRDSENATCYQKSTSRFRVV